MKESILLANFKILSWNQFYAGIHWAKRKNLADTIHKLVYCSVKEQCRTTRFIKPVKIIFHIYLKDKRKRDVDNFAVKFITDGLVESGIIASDDIANVYGIEIYGHYSKENKVIVIIDDKTTHEVKQEGV